MNFNIKSEKDKRIRKEMKENLKKLAKVDSADIIYKELKELVK